MVGQDKKEMRLRWAKSGRKGRRYIKVLEANSTNGLETGELMIRTYRRWRMIGIG